MVLTFKSMRYFTDNSADSNFEVKALNEYSQITVIIPTINEEEGIGPTIKDVRKNLKKAKLLIIDGNSTDKTVKISQKLGVEVIIQKGDGKGDALGQALRHVSSDVEYVVFIDADFTYPAESIPRMVKILESNPEVGMVCGNRFNSHIYLGRMHNILYTGNRTIAFIHNLLNGVQMRDPLTGLRVVRSKILKNWQPVSKSFDVEVEMNHHVERCGYGIAEIPIIYRQRLGKKKLQIKHGFTILKRIILESVKSKM